jgi:hypothetical protein
MNQGFIQVLDIEYSPPKPVKIVPSAKDLAALALGDTE